ncbi:MAG: aldehyde dehydrogenase family protein [Hyphomonadaceae bacterium]|nr:aldehyde dehydrogenase family protein [Hyphomonadaceae bacterium]
MIRLRDPRTGACDGEVAPTAPGAIAATAARLRANQAAWRDAGVDARARALARFRDQIAAHGDAIAAALERDTGRRAIARQEVAGVIGALNGWIAQAPGLIASAWTPGRAMPHIKHRPDFSPFPLVGVISPWNFPLTLSMIDTIPALLAGCAAMLKPSEVTPRFLAPLRAAIAETPAVGAVFEAIVGDGSAGAALIDCVDAVCFTGSVATGRKVAAHCAQRMIPAFLELGGKDPLIILDDADLDDAVTAALRGSVLSTGQACQSIERIYVARPLYDDFVARLTQAAAACRLNWPDIGAGEIGPIIFDKQAAILESQLADAVAKGARILTGGAVEHHGGGLWLRPTVVVDVDHTMTLMTEETFGPIMPVMAFDTVDQAVALANDSVYGLSAAVFAGTLERAESIALQVNAGAVSLNDAALTALFYEAEKHAFGLSGLGGSRMGAAGFHRFLRRKALIANTGKPAPLSAFAEDAASRG